MLRLRVINLSAKESMVTQAKRRQSRLSRPAGIKVQSDNQNGRVTSRVHLVVPPQEASRNRRHTRVSKSVLETSVECWHNSRVLAILFVRVGRPEESAHHLVLSIGVVEGPVPQG